MLVKSLLSLGLVGIAAAIPQPPAPDANDKLNIIKVLESDPDTQYFAVLLKENFKSLYQRIQDFPIGKNKISLTVPEKSAWDLWSYGNAEVFKKENVDMFEAVVGYHIFPYPISITNYPKQTVFIHSFADQKRWNNNTGGQFAGLALRIENGVPHRDVYSGVDERAQIIKFEILKGGIKFDRGEVHILNGVLQLPKDMITTLYDHHRWIFKNLLHEYGLTPAFNQTRDLTVFAPNDDKMRDFMNNNPGFTGEKMKKALLYHAIQNDRYIPSKKQSDPIVYFTSFMREDEDKIRTLYTGDTVKLTYRKDLDQSFLNGYLINNVDRQAMNGCLNELSEFMIPPSLKPPPAGKPPL